MTTYNKLEQALTAAKSLQADLKTFSLDTDDQQAQQMFNQLSTNLDNSIQTIQSRLDFVGSEEPQYVQEAMGMQQQSGSGSQKQNKNQMK